MKKVTGIQIYYSRNVFILHLPFPFFKYMCTHKPIETCVILKCADKFKDAYCKSSKFMAVENRVKYSFITLINA